MDLSDKEIEEIRNQSNCKDCPYAELQEFAEGAYDWCCDMSHCYMADEDEY